jgi:hypothetical protein
MDDDALYARVDEVLGQNQAEIQRRHAAPYDGVMGTLPDWMPANFHREFDAIRGRLLATYSRADLLDYVAEMRGMGMQGDRDAGEFAELVSLADDLETASPSGLLTGTYSRPRTPFKIMADVSILAQFQEAVRRGPVEGLALLTDNEHAGQVIHGKKFPGRKPGSIGPVRKFIRARLAKNHAATNEELWAAIKAKPPKGWTPMESTRLGRYIEGPNAGDNLGWARFCNIASEERKGDSHGLAKA